MNNNSSNQNKSNDIGQQLIEIPFRGASSSDDDDADNDGESNPISLVLRQPSFAALIGHLQTKAGDDLGERPRRIVFDPARSVPLSASQELTHSSLYNSFDLKALNVRLSSGNGFNSLNTFGISESCRRERFPFGGCGCGGGLARPKDRRTQIRMRLTEINASRWEDMGYFPSPMELNAKAFTMLDA